MDKIDKILDRHKAYPLATRKLIEAYAFDEYKKCIADLQRVSETVSVPNTETVIIAMNRIDYERWVKLLDSHWYINQH